MGLPEDKQVAVNMRIANFSSLEIRLNPILNLDSQPTPLILNELSIHADLPYGFIFSSRQTGLIAELLAELKSVRSPCFPYALFMLEDSDDQPAGYDPSRFDCDLIKIDGTDPDEVARKNPQQLKKFVEKAVKSVCLFGKGLCNYD